MSAAEKMNTSSIAAANPTEKNHNGQSGKTKLSEIEFLAQEAENAKAAIQVALRQLSADLGEAVDVRIWTREHPWIAVSLAAGTGFAIASTMQRKSREPSAEKDRSTAESAEESDFEKLCRRVRTEIESGDRGSKKRGGNSAIFGVLGWLAALVAELLKFSTEKFIRQALQPNAPPNAGRKPHEPSHSGNGRHPPPPAPQSTEYPDKWNDA